MFLLTFTRFVLRWLDPLCQHRRSPLLALHLGMAVGAFQEAGVRMAQQIRRHLFAGIVLQQVGGEEMPQGVQVILRWEAIFLIDSAKPPGKRVRVGRSFGG